LESADFSLSKALLELPILDATYGECSRLAVLPEFRFGNLSRELTRQIALRSASRGLDYIFWIAPLAATRNYRKINRSLSIPTRILSHVVVPARESYESHKMHLSVAYIRGYWPDRGTIAPEQSLSA
jgi:hypothetical protein